MEIDMQISDVDCKRKETSWTLLNLQRQHSMNTNIQTTMKRSNGTSKLAVHITLTFDGSTWITTEAGNPN